MSLQDTSPSRRCSLCGGWYTDDTGHDYDLCVQRLTIKLREARRNTLELEVALQQAEQYRKETWWRTGVTKGSA